MRALTANPAALFGLALSEDVTEPQPAAHELVIEVAAVGVNRGEISMLSMIPSGTVPGWDAAGTVIHSAADGSGPATGSKVVSFALAGGAWGQRRAVAATDVAIVPDGVDLGLAAGLPVGGVTALRALQESGDLTGKRVLVTGASGTVGRFAVQLAARAGAHVVAQARRTGGLADLGAHEVVSDLDGVEGIDVAIDNVGGPYLAHAWSALRDGGVVQSIGWIAGMPAAFDCTIAQGKTLNSPVITRTPFGEDLSRLMELVAREELTVELGWRDSWRRHDEALDADNRRNFTGRLVLDVD
ncbi:zinc-binding dehydrogenase [Streptomyces sp. NBC_01217]|uniref:zinc-binding dehydrogenase n=1 Tax=Streptomyces sp. NBC_01217 TaxID=2903779 RepID=UPI002E135B36|nr:zinc-binding dehydrogenase [Streptomyces sp. NBC_01217]